MEKKFICGVWLALRVKKLSQALIDAGYDGVVTIEKEGTAHTSEILDLTTFEPGRALYQSAPAINSEAFKSWFGDSKVVDDDGKPLVVYHGTDQDLRLLILSLAI